MKAGPTYQRSRGNLQHELILPGKSAQSPRNHLVIIYNSFNDPLFQNLVYQFILRQSEKHPEYTFDLITFEQEKYALTPQETSEIQSTLIKKRIQWHPLSYHGGSFILLKKLWDFAVLFQQSLRIKVKNKPKMIIAFANTSAAIAVLISKTLNIPMMVYSFEPHAEFMADFGIWKRDGFKFNILKYLEDLAARQSKFILTGTHQMAQSLQRITRGEVIVAPSTADETIFSFSPEQRKKLREKHQLRDKTVLVYVGKFGGLYYNQEIIDFCASWCSQVRNGYIVILTPSKKTSLQKQFESKMKNQYILSEAQSPQEVSAWLSAADIGLSAVPPLPSQKYRSPLKVAEYLLCGLPYITCKNVSEDDLWARRENVGIVVDLLSASSGKIAGKETEVLLAQNHLRKKCRQVGIRYRGANEVHNAFEKALESID